MDASQEGTGDNHAISALKFKILQEFLELNWHVLLSDVDIVTLQVHSSTEQLHFTTCSMKLCNHLAAVCEHYISLVHRSNMHVAAAADAFE